MRLFALVGSSLLVFPATLLAAANFGMPDPSTSHLAFSATLDDSVDSLGDTFGASTAVLDIARFDAVVAFDSVTFVVAFHNTISPPSAFAVNSAVGFIDIDLDQNFLTGGLSKKSEFSPLGDSRLGAELHVDLFSERFHPGQVEIVDWRAVMPVGMASVTYDDLTFSVEIPLELLGGDATFNYGIIVGDYRDMSDEAPNDGFRSTIPEPSAGALALAAWLCTAACRRNRA